jgi:hypothetical protein
MKTFINQFSAMAKISAEERHATSVIKIVLQKQRLFQ